MLNLKIFIFNINNYIKIFGFIENKLTINSISGPVHPPFSTGGSYKIILKKFMKKRLIFKKILLDFIIFLNFFMAHFIADLLTVWICCRLWVQEGQLISNHSEWIKMDCLKVICYDVRLKPYYNRWKGVLSNG